MLATYKGYIVHKHTIYDSSGNIFTIRRGYSGQTIEQNVAEAVKLIDEHLARLELQAANT